MTSASSKAWPAAPKSRSAAPEGAGVAAVLDAQEAASLLELPVGVVRRLARLGELPAQKDGSSWRFRRAALLRWAARQARAAAKKADASAPPEVPATPDGEASQPAPAPADGAPLVVGIGSSAGGLEALEAFFQHVPEASGLAFVVVQHLDPTRKDMMVELLQRGTAIKVLQAKDGVRVAPDRIYVLPPNQDMAILQGVLHLLAPTAPRGMRLPIDFFFRSLADDQRGRSVGVVLSGMGSDGTLGLRAIKEKGGATFVQEPASAKFDSMPRSAIDAGVADVVAPVEELPAQLVARSSRPVPDAPSDVVLSAKAHRDLDKICVLLRHHTGHDFSHYKRSTVYRRVERRLGLHQLEGLGDYVAYLQANPLEGALLFKELLIGVTGFFRDPAEWEQLKGALLAALRAGRSGGGAFRVWVPACSTGEEAYSVAILLQELIAEVGPERSRPVQIFATDLDPDAIERARAGVYPKSIAEQVSSERLQRWFVPDGAGFRVRSEIRQQVVFAVQNLIMDPPFTKLDLLTCRNLLIYLSPEIQKKLLPLFHYSLGAEGILFLGAAETVGAATDLFVPAGKQGRIYRRRSDPQRPEPVEFPLVARALSPVQAKPEAGRSPTGNLQSLADRLVLDRFAPAAVLTNLRGDILYVSGRTGTFLEATAGKANWNLHVMARDGLRYELTQAFQRAVRERGAATTLQAHLGADGQGRLVEMTIEPLEEPAGLRGMVVVTFTEVPVPLEVAQSGKRAARQASTGHLEQALRRARTEALATREEMQTAQEELRSANEELQSTNEELQSTNEELTTSKEEMQSMNEELQTLNHELQAKLDDLTLAGDDMRNLLDSTDIATLFLDGELKVRRFTAQMTGLIKLIPGDVGRPLSDLASKLVYADLAADARAALKTLTAREVQVGAGDGRWFTVRIMPYRTKDDRVDGVVITFIDITGAKRLEAQLRRDPPPLPGAQ